MAAGKVIRWVEVDGSPSTQNISKIVVANGSISAGTVTISGGASIGSTVTDATEGSVFFAGPSGALAQDNANLFWDDTSNRLDANALRVGNGARFYNGGLAGTELMDVGQSVFGVKISAYSASSVPLLLQLAAAQSADAFQVKTSGGLDNFIVDKNCTPGIKVNSAPADGDIDSNQLFWWFDSTNGAAKAKFKGKSANGTVVSGEVALA